MNVLNKFLAAWGCSEGFSIGWKRVSHMENGHPFDKSERIDKLVSEKHPHSDSEMIYTVNIRHCNDCGLTYNDCGLEYRRIL